VLAEKDPELWRFWDVALTDAGFAYRVREWTHKFWAVQPGNRHEFAVESAIQMEMTDPAFSCYCARGWRSTAFCADNAWPEQTGRRVIGGP